MWMSCMLLNKIFLFLINILWKIKNERHSIFKKIVFWSKFYMYPFNWMTKVPCCCFRDPLMWDPLPFPSILLSWRLHLSLSLSWQYYFDQKYLLFNLFRQLPPLVVRESKAPFSLFSIVELCSFLLNFDSLLDCKADLSSAYIVLFALTLTCNCSQAFLWSFL